MRRGWRAGCRLVAAACLASGPLAATARDLTIIATLVENPVQLHDSIHAGNQHVVIQAHIDLTDVSAGNPCGRSGPASAHDSLFCVRDSTLTISGSCRNKTLPDRDLRGPLQPQQCVLLSHAPIFQFPLAGQQVWLSNLYLHSLRSANPEVFANMLLLGSNFDHVAEQGALGHVWITDTTLEGDALQEHDGSALEVYDGFDVYMRDCAILGFHSHRSTGSAVYIHGGSAALHRVTITSNSVNPSFAAASDADGSPMSNGSFAAGAVFAHHGFLWFQDCSFRGNAPHDVAVLNDSTHVHSNAPGFEVMDASLGRTRPAEQIEGDPVEPFLSGQADSFLRMQQELANATLVPSLAVGALPPAEDPPAAEEASDYNRRNLTLPDVPAPTGCNTPLGCAAIPIIAASCAVSFCVLVCGVVMIVWLRTHAHKPHTHSPRYSHADLRMQSIHSTGNDGQANGDYADRHNSYGANGDDGCAPGAPHFPGKPHLQRGGSVDSSEANNHMPRGPRCSVGTHPDAPLLPRAPGGRLHGEGVAADELAPAGLAWSDRGAAVPSSPAQESTGQSPSWPTSGGSGRRNGSSVGSGGGGWAGRGLLPRAWMPIASSSGGPQTASVQTFSRSQDTDARSRGSSYATAKSKDDMPSDSQRDLLKRVLRQMHRHETSFANVYEVLGPLEQCQGGQALVQFMRKDGTGYAVKFLFRLKDFNRELELYQIQALNSVMPPLVHACDNQSGQLRDSSGYQFPPFLIMERGQDLLSWLKTVEHSFITVVQALVHLVECLDALHRAGWAHRDLKPSNVLRMPRTHGWTLLDFGCAASIATEGSVVFSPQYAAPEVIAAWERGERTMWVTAAVDMYALGMIAFEMLTGTRCFDRFTSSTEMVDRTLGRLPMPWEHGATNCRENVKKLRVFKDSVLACLDRDPAARPTSKNLMVQWDQIFTQQTRTIREQPLGAVRPD